MTHVDRRDFLGATAGLAASLYLSGSATAADASNKPVRIAVMGCGGRGGALAKSFAGQPGVTVATVCDPDSTRMTNVAAALKKQTGAAPTLQADIRKLLDDESIDALVVAAPNHWHGPATIMACGAGKHVYVEKPCSYNPAEGEMMIAAAAKNGRVVQVGTQRRSQSAIQEGIKLVHDGAIGEAYYGRSWYANVRGPIGKGEATDPPKELNYDLWQGPAPRKPFHSNYLHYTWHWFWHWGNGEVGNNGPHSLDLCRQALQVEYPTRVVSSGGRYAYDDDQETPDTHVVGYEFDGGKQMMWEGLSCNRHGCDKTGFGATIHGNGGTLTISASGYVLYDDRGKEVRKQTGNGNGDAEHIPNFLAAVRAGDASLLNCDIETGHKSTLLAHLGNIAHRTGRTLNCDNSNGHVKNDDEAMKLWRRDYEPGWEPTV
ncbi:MAG: Gfo/Idh/MocA family oxidoreductase [Planctomycetaceae bacterium]